MPRKKQPPKKPSLNPAIEVLTKAQLESEARYFELKYPGDKRKAKSCEFVISLLQSLQAIEKDYRAAQRGKAK